MFYFVSGADIKLLKSRYSRTPDGYYMIPVGDKYASDDKIVFIKGTNRNPKKSLPDQLMILRSLYSRQESA